MPQLKADQIMYYLVMGWTTITILSIMYLANLGPEAAERYVSMLTDPSDPLFWFFSW